MVGQQPERGLWKASGPLEESSHTLGRGLQMDPADLRLAARRQRGATNQQETDRQSERKAGGKRDLVLGRRVAHK